MYGDNLNYKYNKLNNTVTFYTVLAVDYVIFFHHFASSSLFGPNTPQPPTVSQLRSALKNKFYHPNKIIYKNICVYYQSFIYSPTDALVSCLVKHY